MANFMKSGYFTVTPQVLAQDDRLSWKARGIFLYLASMPDGWDFYMDEIVKHSPGGKRALTSGIRELEEYGYLTREMQHGKHGKFGNMIWVLHTEPTERPQTQKDDKNDIPTENKSRKSPVNQHSHRQVQNSVNGKTPSTAKCVQRKTRLTHNAPLQKNHNIKEPEQKNNNSNILSYSSNNGSAHAEQTELLTNQPAKQINNSSQRDQQQDVDNKTTLYQAVINCLNQHTGKHYRSTTKATQRLINGRVKEGATLADFKHVIAVKCRQWQGTSMQQYLRPSTLFSPQHFEEYAQEPLQQPIPTGRKVIEQLPEWAQQPLQQETTSKQIQINQSKDKAALAQERQALLDQLCSTQ